MVQGPLSRRGSELRVQVAASHKHPCSQGRSQEPSPNPLRGKCFWQRNGFSRAPRAAAGSGRSEHRKRTPIPSRTARKLHLSLSFPASAGPIPQSPRRGTDPQRKPRHSATAKQVRAPGGVCGVPSERTGCAEYPGFHPGLVCDSPLGHSERLTSPEASCAPTKRQRERGGASIGTSTS